MQIPPTIAKDAGWNEDGANEDAGDRHYRLRRPDGNVTARLGSQVNDGELEEGTTDDWTKEEVTSRLNRFYSQVELVIPNRKIFGDEEEEEDREF